MEQRLNQRYQVQFEAKVTKLNNREHSACGRVADISTSGISVSMPLQFEPGDVVELEMADSVLSGRVVYCNAGDLLFRTGIEIEQVRLGASGLSHLLQRTLIEAMPGTRGLEPTEVSFG